MKEYSFTKKLRSVGRWEGHMHFSSIFLGKLLSFCCVSNPGQIHAIFLIRHELQDLILLRWLTIKSPLGPVKSDEVAMARISGPSWAEPE